MMGYNLQADHAPVIREIVKALGCETYLERGVSSGCTIHEVATVCPNCIGVDIKDDRTFFDFEFKLMSTTDFFSNNELKFDVIFIDADHSVESVYGDFLDSLRFLKELGVIILHDTDPINEEHTREDLCGDAYRVKQWIKDDFPELGMVTLPIGVAGLTIISKNKSRL